MKKFLLSFGVIIIFAFYALLNSNRNTPSQQLIATNQTQTTTDVIPSTPIVADTNISTKTTVPTPNPIPTPIVVANSGKYKDGTYTGPVVNAYYGNVQVSALVHGGRLTDVTFLQYPKDRNNSVRINARAMPILKSEAITAQSASVNGASGATATSDAFKQSLGSALATAVN
jgi:uncharacterized protein with FMN-binding domain